MFKSLNARLGLINDALETAARRGAPHDIELEVAGEGETARLARNLNAMAGAVATREARLIEGVGVDQGTGLASRVVLEAAFPTSEGRSVAVIGIDRFAELRSALGYQLAGRLIGRIGERLAAFWPETTIAGLSVDSLAFILDTLRSEAAVSLLLDALEEPMEIDGATVDVALTAGIARIDREEPIPVIERASIALDQARAASKKVATFDPKSYGDPADRLTLMSDMQAAMRTGALSLHYQPKYSLKERAVVGAEGLIRWRHPVKGAISPDLFIGLAEETGHIKALTRWTLTRIIADQARLKAEGHDILLSLNLSGRLLSDRAFIEEAIWAVKAADAKLCFEITETAAFMNQSAALEGVKAVRAAGIAISIDDYGAGLSSLSYLKALPADELKIDKVFIQQLSESARDALLVKSTVDLAHSLGLKVVAEGVETPQAVALLSGMGCDIVQGWHIAKALPLDKLIEFLSEASVLKGWVAQAS